MIAIIRRYIDRIRRAVAAWFIDGVRVERMHVVQLHQGANTIRTNPDGAGDVQRWSGAQEALDLLDMGMRSDGRLSAHDGNDALGIPFMRDATRRYADLASINGQNLTLSGEQTIDGVLTSSSRVLAWQQTTGSENGLWITGAGAWTRSSDYTDATKDGIESGFKVFVKGGGTNTSREFTLTAPTTPITIDTTDTTWVMSSAQAGAVHQVYTASLASILAQYPLAGDVGIPTDSPYRLIYDGTAWRYAYSGWSVTPPVSGDWSAFALAGSSSISYADGTQVLNLDQTATADRQGATHAIVEGNKYTFSCRYLMLGGQGATADFMGVGFRSSVTDEGLILDVRNEVLGALNPNFTVGRITAWDGGIVKVKETDRLEHNDLWLFVQLEYASGTLTFRLAKSPQGPWTDFYSEADTTHFTSDPDQVVFWAIHRSVEVSILPFILAGFTSESA